MEYRINDVIKVEIPKFGKGYFICKILDLNAENDCGRHIKLQIIQDSQRFDTIYYEPEERCISVEEDWLDEALTGRKITKLDFYANYVERKNPKNKLEKHLKFLILVDGVEISTHADLETAKLHIDKINRTKGNRSYINIPKW